MFLQGNLDKRYKDDNQYSTTVTNEDTEGIGTTMLDKECSVRDKQVKEVIYAV